MERLTDADFEISDKELKTWKEQCWIASEGPELSLEKWLYSNLKAYDIWMRKSMDICSFAFPDWDAATRGPQVFVMIEDDDPRIATGMCDLLDMFASQDDFEQDIEPGLQAIERKIAELRAQHKS